MAELVRSHAPPIQSPGQAGDHHQFLKQQLHGSVSERSAAFAGREHQPLGPGSDPTAERSKDLSGDRQRPVFASFAFADKQQAATKIEIRYLKLGKFRATQSAIKGDQEQNTVSFTRRGAQKPLRFVVGQKTWEFTAHAATVLQTRFQGRVSQKSGIAKPTIEKTDQTPPCHSSRIELAPDKTKSSKRPFATAEGLAQLVAISQTWSNHFPLSC